VACALELQVESFILKAFGEEAWNKIVAESGVQYGWVSSCPYPDKITYE
jgi:guanylate cyclase soluble subunit beta